ncbi:MAG: hypothetical protein J6W28_03145, partial [Clostridia bacterium]|nr:hypothetical protein [Clostridia bacterium]
MERTSRHPKINYWFWTEETLLHRGYLDTLERIVATSRFDTITLTDRGCDFWDLSHKEDFRLLVARAHALGVKIVLQLWPKGSLDHSATAFLTEEEAAAIAIDDESSIC